MLRRPVDLCETPKCCSHTSLRRSRRLTRRSSGEAQGWQDAGGCEAPWTSAIVAASSSAVQRWSLWTCHSQHER